MKKIQVNQSKLNLDKESIAALTGEEIDSINGGYEKFPTRGASTKNDFTCGLCTTIIDPE
ncbi:class I lanthipeptide [Chitinophaga sp. Hz27]|uniref:class I lanthipeptide n=1 Tax=Chitinophaga sp. Hz27 TaxID=3347169 RepID=UPI0035DB4036